ncbi:C-X-C chemokine receptor type 2 [Ophiophagus hannah]|uniref:C-X-C chemokine receptor type 2 n=1 Tax=Ophiophagus hannah TaxID=8665 RepID=V8NZM5_OPHHA|nr:C-X-C chemokine receptor type 2 [Ophiophagus hannah]
MGDNSLNWDDIVLSGIPDNYSDCLNDTIESLGLQKEIQDGRIRRQLGVCYENIGGNQTTEWRIVLRILPQVFGFLLPLTVMIICYGITTHRLYQMKNKQKKKAMKVILAVVLVFVICWLPYNIALLFDTLLRLRYITETCSVRERIDEALSSTEILGVAHSCINPIIYAFIGQKFRNNFLKILVSRGIISKEMLMRYRKGSTYSSTFGNTSTTL